jgi:hypothetical protein
MQPRIGGGEEISIKRGELRRGRTLQGRRVELFRENVIDDEIYRAALARGRR